VITQDVRYAVRVLAAKPAFAAFAIASLALGLGANIAIFNLWHSALHAPLPVVENPTTLVMLTDPQASGWLRGRWNSSTDGPRSWVSYAEFEQLRDETSAFSAVMATQSTLNEWQVRIDGGGPEEARGRLVSGEFFHVLGVRPAAGRLFSVAEDHGDPTWAVISYAYWQRRFGGRPDVVGRKVVFGDTVVTIVGVAPSGFIGETAGQLPDLWLPLRLQPRLLPGDDWLRDQPPDKVMWLRVFGRLRLGTTSRQAEAQINAVFRRNLESFYGQMADDRRREFLDQRLRISSGARGATPTAAQFSASLSVLLASVGILLIITCANLANLLLARGAARRGEVAVRLSLGARRGRLIRQLLVESLVLGALGGIAAIGVANLLHGVLVRLLQAADSRFAVAFSPDPTTFLFAIAATAVAVVAVGAMPALMMTDVDAAAGLQDISRGAIGSRTESRAGRWLVAVQLALCLPLLVGAGLLVRTVYNLEHPSLGFRQERLLLARVELGEIALDVTRRDAILRELQSRIARLPGVTTATFSQLGLFSGGVSTRAVAIEGSSAAGERGLNSALDRVGSHYFATMGIPLLGGRDIAETDTADSPRVCVVNEAFVRQFFSGRPPLGLHVTILDERAGTPYEVVGVVANARTQSLRDDIEPRFFVPAEQLASGAVSRTFLIRMSGTGAGISAAVENALRAVSPALSVPHIVSFEEQLHELTAEDRAVARLAVTSGTVALLLAALGLYGVLSYGVSRRSSEIAIRIALGAQSHTVIRMILSESLRMVLAGLVAGGALSFVIGRAIGMRLYGVPPGDPFTLTAAVSLFLIVAAAAAYVPARRASRVDPMTALHHG